MDPLLRWERSVDLSNGGETAVEVGRRHAVGRKLTAKHVVVDQPVVHLRPFHEELPKPGIMEITHQRRHKRPMLPQVVRLPQKDDAVVFEPGEDLGRNCLPVEHHCVPCEYNRQFIARHVRAAGASRHTGRSDEPQQGQLESLRPSHSQTSQCVRYTLQIGRFGRSAPFAQVAAAPAKSRRNYSRIPGCCGTRRWRQDRYRRGYVAGRENQERVNGPSPILRPIGRRLSIRPPSVTCGGTLPAA